MDVLFVVFATLSQTTVPPLFFILHVVDACVSGAPTAENAEVVRVGVVDMLSGYPDTDTVGGAILGSVGICFHGCQILFAIVRTNMRPSHVVYLCTLYFESLTVKTSKIPLSGYGLEP